MDNRDHSFAQSAIKKQVFASDVVEGYRGVGPTPLTEGLNIYSDSATQVLRMSSRSSTNNWKLTFADLLALLVVFFVMIYMLVHLSKRPWIEVYTALEERFNPYPISVVATYVSEYGEKSAKDLPSDMITYWYNYLRFYTHQQQIEVAEISAHDNYAKMAIALEKLLESDRVASGSSVILDSVRDLLTKLTANLEIVSYIDGNLTNPSDAAEKRLHQQLQLLSILDPAGASGKRVANKVFFSSDPNLLNQVEFHFLTR